MGLYDEIRRGVERIAKNRYGSPTAMCRELGMASQQPKISRLLGTGSVPAADFVAELLDKLGVRLIWPDQVKDTAQEVVFIDYEVARTASAALRVTPKAEDYRAIPLTSEDVAAGPGLVPEDSIQGWVLLWRHIPALMTRRNLVASKIGHNQRSMTPVLHPGDYIVIDRDDITVPDSPHGNVFLVRDPHDGLAVKRVRVQSRAGHTMLVLYSENPEYPPDIIDLTADYDGDFGRAIVGRVVYSWSDMTKK
ncbi:S24/S26 family peptidase [Desulfocurvibacter africanus]|uniref:Peptidase S24/S26A/S26B n=1 Tax=Desulfocurvibacter africanus subsp. africanus str. Walvis Bay TaxID=690850 RepID=F3YY85_DESAF|nr:S24/S26 family peptidase [Desulfocurvibacter africanus]EGJ51861.1 peptidase S24/S26A/S26B [Desulfocurvibacter africanus subsp. africanus str. Walvis Bay]